MFAAVLAFVAVVLLGAYTSLRGRRVGGARAAPGPRPWPVVGSLHELGKHDVPFRAFTALSQTYGDIFSITLGTTPCLVVNNLDLIREVLNQNGKFFGGRPDFIRYNVLFGGDRENSLALCDWSNLQIKRRNLARRHCSPRQHSDYYAKIGSVADFEVRELMNSIRAKSSLARSKGAELNVKPIIMAACLNMFSNYMCTKRFDAENDVEFSKVSAYFDEIFWEINQGYAVDFLPWLLPFYRKHMGHLAHWSQEIRRFILARIIDERELNLDDDDVEHDFTDGLLKSLRDDPDVDKTTIIFMLEDFLGGHAAIGNLVMLTLAALVKNPEIALQMREEIAKVTNTERPVLLADKPNLPYTAATILETLRYASSPIVPHVATEDAKIAGYDVEKGTVVFINNYVLNTSEKYWSEPEKFNPERFVERIKVKIDRRRSENDSGVESDTETARPDVADVKSKQSYAESEIVDLKRNIPHFLPFSIGKRTCLGQALVHAFSFVIVANILQEFDVVSKNAAGIKTWDACVALPRETFSLQFIPRNRKLLFN